MAIDAKELGRRATELARRPRTRKIAIWFVSVVVAVGVLFGLVAPPLLRGKLASELSKKLHREVSIERIRINPYAMTATVRGFLMKERQGTATAVSFDELHVNLELQSLYRWGPVIKELRLIKPYINLVRNEDFKYNYQDLIDEFMSGPPGPTPRFSLNNIQISDGRIDFDDRPEETKHTISAIKIGVPFVSSLPSYVDIRVQPAFSALLNGAPVEIGGEAKPFKDSRESNVHLNIDKLQIPKYLEYSPVALNFKVPSGQINGKLTASFRSFKEKPSILAISGNLAVQDFQMQEKGEIPLLNLASLELTIDAVEVFANKAGIKALKTQGLELHLRRHRDGKVNLANLVETPAQAAPAEPKKSGTPLTFHVDEILLESGKLHFTDETPQRPYRTRLDNLRIDVKGLTNEPEKKAAVDIAFDSEAKERFQHTGALQLTPLLVEGKLQIEGLRPGGLKPYYQDALAVEIRDGAVDFSTLYSLGQKNGKTELKFSELNTALRNLRLEEPGQAEPILRLPSLAIKEGTVDLNNKVIVVGRVEGRDGSGFVQRNADGTFNYDRLVKSQAPPAPSKEVEKKDESGWKIEAKQIALDRFKVSFEDRAPATPVKINLSELSIRGEKFSNAKNQRGKTAIQTRINNNGAIKLIGTAGANPVIVNLAVEGQDVDLLPFRPYLENQVNFILTGGRVGTKGNLTLDGGSGGPAKVGYEGSVQVADFATVEKSGAQDLIKWKSLGLDGIQFALEPMQLRISEINLADFYSRVIIGPDGKINLQNLTVQRAEKTEAAAKAESAEKPAQAAPTAPASEKRITIGKINLQAGNVLFSDFFVKPNYSANLTGVQGSISELKADMPGDLAIQAKLDNASPVDIQGKINPLSKELYMDITADAKEIELNAMSPYSVKYVGYGIEKGKLSFNVKYKLDNRKLEAQNQIILNQLTFGERVESPTATKLPVLLAVALLKDRNGVIDVNLPISGSLDEPQFSVGGIVLKLILNIITKAVTAPFAFLGAAFGGGGEELSYIEFDYGRARLTQAAEAKLKTLATAMNNRPALKLEINPRVDSVNDLEGLKRANIEGKVKAQKMKELLRQGSAPRSVDEVQIVSGEYERYLKAAYGDESFPKPRNLIGLAKDLPVPEMEGLMLKYTNVTDGDLRELANRRAQAVRDYLLATKQVSVDRLFIVASRPGSGEEKETAKAKTSRVDFSLK